MTHVSETEMIAEIYGESENPSAVERHLAACARCKASFAELRRDLAEIESMVAPPRDASYGLRVWAAIAGALPDYAPLERSRWQAFGWRTMFASPWFKPAGYASACALLLSSGFFAGRAWDHKQAGVPPQAEARNVVAPAAPAAPRQPIVVVVLDDHLDRSERFLVELKHAVFDTTAMASPMGEEARSLLAANRVCRRNAAQSDPGRTDPELTTALDHLDSLLAEAANEPGGLNAASITRLQQKMNSNGLLFEVRVLRSRMAHRGAPAESEEGGTI